MDKEVKRANATLIPDLDVLPERLEALIEYKRFFHEKCIGLYTDS